MLSSDYTELLIFIFILFIYLFSKLSNEDIHINDKKHNVLNLHGSRRGCSPLHVTTKNTNKLSQYTKNTYDGEKIP